MRVSVFLALLAVVLGVLTPSGPASADEYRSHAQVLDALEQLEAAHPDVVSKLDLGTTHEGRTIRAIKISDDPGLDDPNEPDILIVGGHHAREWVSIEVPLRIAEHLAANYDDPAIKDLVDSREIWFIPLLNPDGYEYSRLPSNVGSGCSVLSLSEPRCWRKNRRDLPLGFFGVDLNRNYAFEWGGEGSSSFFGSYVYKGTDPFSEPGTQLVKALVVARNITRLLSYHSYSQAILYPWSHTGDSAPDEPLLRSIAERMKSEIKAVHGRSYCAGQGKQCIGYNAGGELTDWAYGERGVLAFTIELRPATASPGFLLPTDEIQPTFEENLPAALFFIGLSRGRVMDFETGADSQAISSTIPGMAFTTTEGFDWVYGDERLPDYNVASAPDPSGPYACNRSFFAWLGPNQGLGQIDFVDDNFKTVGLSYSSLSTTFFKGYDNEGSLVDVASGAGNLGTGLLERLTIQGDISRVLVHDAGNFWLIDDLFVTDALSEAQALVPGKYDRPLEVVESYVSDETKSFQLVNLKDQELSIVLEWPGSTFALKVIRPDNSIFANEQSDTPPIHVIVPNAEPGTWVFEVAAVDVADGEPAALVVGTFDPEDTDGDGIVTAEDNCPTHRNPQQADSDEDAVGDVCDNCPTMANADQQDLFPADGPEGPGNGIGDACETVPDDIDEDGVANDEDNCPGIPNPGQSDLDGDGIGDACESDGLLVVVVDIKPGSHENSVNPRSNGKIPVAIPSTEDFDAAMVDPLSVAFGPAAAEEAHGRGHYDDVDEDGMMDLVLHFTTRETGIACGDVAASLTGQTFDGQVFQGSDSLTTVGCSKEDDPEQPEMPQIETDNEPVASGRKCFSSVSENR